MTAARGIFMLFDNMNRDYVTRLHAGASRYRSPNNLELRMQNLHGTDAKPDELIADEAIGGVILTAPLSDDRHLLLGLERRGIPFARIAPMLDLERGITVCMDEYDAARAVTAVLLDAGHRHIGIIRGPRSHLSSIRRYNGFTAGLGAGGLKVDPRLVVEGDYTRASGEAEGPKLIAAGATAIFASNDAMAAGFVDAANKSRKKLPQDISIVGFDDDPIAKTMNPQLTSVRQPLEEMGAKAVELLAEAMAGKGSATSHVDVPFTIIERSSVAPPLA